MCRKAAIAWGFDTDNGGFVDSTASFLLKVVGKNPSLWDIRRGSAKSEVTLEEVKDRVSMRNLRLNLGVIDVILLPSTIDWESRSSYR